MYNNKSRAHTISVMISDFFTSLTIAVFTSASKAMSVTKLHKTIDGFPRTHVNANSFQMGTGRSFFFPDFPCLCVNAPVECQ